MARRVLKVTIVCRPTSLPIWSTSWARSTTSFTIKCDLVGSSLMLQRYFITKSFTQLYLELVMLWHSLSEGINVFDTLLVLSKYTMEMRLCVVGMAKLFSWSLSLETWASRVQRLLFQRLRFGLFRTRKVLYLLRFVILIWVNSRDQVRSKLEIVPFDVIMVHILPELGSISFLLNVWKLFQVCKQSRSTFIWKSY